MLLIAQPKSGSTSLACTIAKIQKLRCNLGIPKKAKDKPCNELKHIQKLHNNMPKRSELFIKQVINGRKTLFKEHLIPSKEHIDILRKIKTNYVILLRNPEASAEAYKRVGAKVTDGVRQDLIDFHNKYMWFASNKKNVLVIYFEDLILNYRNVIKRIMKHYGLNPKKVIPMLKKKYTGVGAKEVREQHESEKDLNTINAAAKHMQDIIENPDKPINIDPPIELANKHHESEKSEIIISDPYSGDPIFVKTGNKEDK